MQEIQEHLDLDLLVLDGEDAASPWSKKISWKSSLIRYTHTTPSREDQEKSSGSQMILIDIYLQHNQLKEPVLLIHKMHFGICE